MYTNNAAWLGPGHAQLDVRGAPYTSPRAGEIVVRNHAVAINPVDWIIQIAGNVAYRWLKYPFIIGNDVAGEVVEVGEGVARFEVGDRVLGHAVGTEKDRNSSAEGAFQSYTVLLEHMAAPIPDSLRFENAAVLPLAVSTAASGLFQKDQLALDYPSLNPEPKDKTLLVWGGSTSVGSNAIQLAVAAGYEVVTTASPRNFDYVKTLGAAQAFDYRSKTVVQDVTAAFQGKHLAGVLAIGVGSAQPCVEIASGCHGNKCVALTSPPVFLGDGMNVKVGLQFVVSSIMLRVSSTIKRVRTEAVWGSSLKGNEVSELIYQRFLPEALAAGRYQAAPDAQIVGSGLDEIQAALDIQREGVSARKIVVSL